MRAPNRFIPSQPGSGRRQEAVVRPPHTFSYPSGASSIQSSPSSHPRRTPRRARAFTLIEVLVAAALTAGLAALSFTIVRDLAVVWTRSSGRLSADTQARLVLDRLTQDLQGAMYRDDGNTWFAADVLDRTSNPGSLWTEASRNPKPTGTNTISGSVNLATASIADARNGKAGMWVRFFTGRHAATPPTTGTVDPVNTAGAPVAVAYQLIRRFTATNTTNQNAAYLLHRSEARPAATTVGQVRPGVLESGYNILAAAYTTSTTTTNDGSVTGDPRGIQVPGTNAGSNGRNLDAVIADNVVDFGIRCYVRDPSVPGGLRLVYPADATGKPTGTTTARYRPTLPPGTAPDPTNFASIYPDVVDVMIRILTDDGAAQIANIEKLQTPTLTVPQKYSGNAGTWWWGVANENSRVYTRRIVLNARPL